MITKTDIEKGDIYYASLDPVIGSVQEGNRPVVVVQNNYGNQYNPTLIIAPLTKILKKPNLPTHVLVNRNYFLKYDSQILLEQIRVIDKTRLINYLGTLTEQEKQKIDSALIETFNIDLLGYLRSKGIGEINNDRTKRLYSQHYCNKNEYNNKNKYYSNK